MLAPHHRALQLAQVQAESQSVVAPPCPAKWHARAKGNTARRSAEHALGRELSQLVRDRVVAGPPSENAPKRSNHTR